MSTPTITFMSMPYLSVSHLDTETRRGNEGYPLEMWYSRENVFCDTLRGLVEISDGDLGVRYNAHRSQIEVCILEGGELAAPSVEGYRALFWVARQVLEAQNIFRSLQDPERPLLRVERVVLKAHDPKAFEWEVASLGV